MRGFKEGPAGSAVWPLLSERSQVFLGTTGYEEASSPGPPPLSIQGRGEMQAQAGLCKSPQQPPHLHPHTSSEADTGRPRPATRCNTHWPALLSLAPPGPGLGHFPGLLAPVGEGARRVRVPLCFPLQVAGFPRGEAGIGVMCIVSGQSTCPPRPPRVRQVGPRLLLPA